MLDGQHHAYGKGLAFAHDREMFDERDIPLIDLVLLLAEQRVRQNVPAFALKGSLLDQAMRVLLGREVELKKDGEDPVRVPVRTGEITPAVSLETSDGGAKLRVKTPDVTLGLSGAYEFLPTGVVCAYGADFRRVEALLRAAAERPNGLPLEEKQIEPICAQVIAPSRAQVIQGRKTVLRHTPMEMTARFYLDADEKDALLCRPEWHYGAERVRPGEDTPHIRRDAFRENQALTRVRALFPEQRTEGEYAFDGDDDARYALLTERLRELDAVGEVMVSDRLARMNVKAPRAITFGMQRQGAKLLVHADLGGLTQADLDAVREIAVDVTVLAPEIETVPVSAQMLPKTGVRFETAKIAAEKAVKALFTGALLGKNLYRSAISSAIFATGLVENVALLQPQADIPAAAKTLCRLGALTITEADA